MSIKFENNAKSTLSAAISNSSTSLSVPASDGSKFPEIVAPNYAYATLDDGTNKEVVKVTAHTAGASSFTVVRAQDSIAGATTAYSFAAGAKFEMRPCAALFESILAEALAAASELSFTNSVDNTGTVGVTSAQRGYVFNLTYASAATTVSNSDAASTCGNGFFFAVRNSSKFTATFDPNGSETVDGASTITIAPGEVRAFYTDGSNWFTIFVKQTEERMVPVSGGWMCPHKNLKVDYVSAATVSVTADEVWLTDANGKFKRFTGLSLTGGGALNMAGGDAAGGLVGIGGAAPAAEAGNAWYHRWAIGKADGTVSAVFSLADPSAVEVPSLPTDYIYYGYLGAERNNGSSNLIESYQRNDLHSISIQNALSAGAAAAITSVSLSSYAPTTAKQANLRVEAINVAGGANGDPVSSVYSTSGGVGGGTIGTVNANSSGSALGQLSVDLVTPQTVWYINNNGASYATSIYVNGWRY